MVSPSSGVPLCRAEQAKLRKAKPRLLCPPRAGTPTPLGLPELRGRRQELAAPAPRLSIWWQSSRVCQSSATPGPRGDSPEQKGPVPQQPVLHFSLAGSLWLAVLCPHFLLSRGVLSAGHLTGPVLSGLSLAGPQTRDPCGSPALPSAHLGESCSRAPEGKSSQASTGAAQRRCSCCNFTLQYQRAKFCFAKSTAPDNPLPLSRERLGKLPCHRGSPQPLLPPSLFQQHLTSAGPGETVSCFLFNQRSLAGSCLLAGTLQAWQLLRKPPLCSLSFSLP